MPTTLTAESYHKQPAQPPSGMIAQHFRFQHSPSSPTFHPATFGSQGDTVLLLRVPEGAMIIDCRARVGPKNDGSGELRMILTPASGSATRTLAVIGSLSISVLTSPCLFTPGLDFAPFQISYSAADSRNDIALKAIIMNSTATASLSIEGVLIYQMNVDRRGGGTQGTP